MDLDGLPSLKSAFADILSIVKNDPHLSTADAISKMRDDLPQHGVLNEIRKSPEQITLLNKHVSVTMYMGRVFFVRLL